jgi:hypothetical protein
VLIRCLSSHHHPVNKRSRIGLASWIPSLSTMTSQRVQSYTLSHHIYPILIMLSSVGATLFQICGFRSNPSRFDGSSRTSANNCFYVRILENQLTTNCFLLLKVHDLCQTCNAFVTKLKQIWSRLFPSHSTEREPVLQYDACLEIHSVMKELHRTSFRNRKTAFLLAFCEENFHSADFLRQYLHESQHTYATDSHISCAQYLNSLYALLEECQVMYDTQYKTRPPTTVGSSHQTLTAQTSVPRRTTKPQRP